MNRYVLEARKRVLGVEHPEKLDSMYNMATTLLRFEEVQGGTSAEV